MDKSRINRVIVEEFDRLAFLTELEKSQYWQTQKYNVSQATVTRAVQRLQRKYDAVKGFSAILPDDLII